MSEQTVRRFLSEYAPDLVIEEASESTATVLLAAQVHGVALGQIAKTLAFRLTDKVIVIVLSGDTRLDNKKYKQLFGVKAKMLPAEEVLTETTHPVGGVCPFGLPENVTVYCDVALKNYDVVMPAAGSAHTSVCIAPERMALLTHAQWINICKL